MIWCERAIYAFVVLGILHMLAYCLADAGTHDERKKLRLTGFWLAVALVAAVVHEIVTRG